MLARTLSRTTDELFDSMSAEQYGKWYEYYCIDPWDERRADMRAGYTTAMNAWTHGADQVQVVDFMPYEIKPAPKPHTTEGLMSFLDEVNG